MLLRLVQKCAYRVVVGGNDIWAKKGTLPPRHAMSRDGGGNVAQEDVPVDLLKVHANYWMVCVGRDQHVNGGSVR